MINFEDARISSLCIHHIGNHSENEGIRFSESVIEVEDYQTQDILLKYFFGNFKEPEFYNLTFSTGDVTMNPIHKYAKELFADQNLLMSHSSHIAKILYNNSTHPNIKSGDLMIAQVQDVLIDDEMVDAICVFKSENKEAFITLDLTQKSYAIDRSEGIHAEKLDKACIIFNTEGETGYKICALDKSNKSKEAQYWMTDFLNVTHRADDYHHTKNYIKATKQFIEDRVKPLYEIDKVDEADLLKRSKDYLDNTEQFNEKEYLEQTFNSPEVIQEFEAYKQDYKEERNVELKEDFTVHHAAVKNQSKVFKSVLKLDKNFHIYIHGDRELIEKGTENGRKYYKIFYEEEK